VDERGWERRFEALAKDVIAQGQIPGAAVALAYNSEVVYEHGFGHRDADARLPVTPDTRFGLGSVTKSFPALAIIQLEEAGTLKVTDPVVRWLPEFRLPRAEDARDVPEITIHHFLTHTSGIPPEPSLLHARAASICADPDLDRMHPRPMGVPANIRDFERVSTYEELIGLMARQDFAALGPPGRAISYSNEGYVLLAAIVERASGQPFPAYLQEHVLDPLGMTRTSLYTAQTPPLEPEVIPFAVDTRRGTREVFPSPAWWDQGQMFGNGGLKSTTRDLLRYLEVYRTGGTSHGQRIVTAAGVEKMTTPHQPIPPGGSYGYGLRIVEAPGGLKAIEHGGGNKGVATHVVMVPEAGLTAVALTNLANAPASKLAYGAINAYRGLAPETPWEVFPEHAVEPGTLSRFVGTYQGQPGTMAQVSERDGTLIVDLGGAQNPARPYAERAFYIEATDDAIRFLEDDTGDVWAVAVGLRTFPKIL
jgi:CubicO group peptidase (beta-lactamase class C family)